MAVALSGPLSSYVERYEVVKPRRLHGVEKRSLLSNNHQLYPDTVRYEIGIEGRNHAVHLEKNRNLLGSGYTETHYSEDGRRSTVSSRNEEHCYYHGHIEGMKDSSVSVGICSGISGFVRAEQQVYLIEPLGNTEDGEHAVYRHEHLRISGSPGCGSSSNTSTLYDHQDGGPRLSGLFKSRSWKSKPTTGSQRFVELFVVVDNAEYRRYGSQTKSRILGVVNHVDKLYRPLNIRIVLVGLEIWKYKDIIPVDSNSDRALDKFIVWRQADLLKRSKHDNAQFVTGSDFDGDTVGLANKFAMCTVNSGGINQDHHDNPIGLASTIAHEMGHNLGLSHDAPSCMCGSSFSGGSCVMADKLRTGSQAFPEFFSDCSEEQLAEFLERAQPDCLSKPGSVSTEAGPRCGDAFLDPGEECDCGTVEECTNRCCDASTCRLAEGARCAHGECCDNCQLKQSGSVCRSAAGECDLSEYCTGLSGFCPEDAFEMNGTPCSDMGDGYCHDGQCPTHQQHCWRLFGSGAKVGSDACFALNRGGRDGANCGRTTYGYNRCTPPNVKCGSIFCEAQSEPITGKKAVFTVPNKGKCTVAVDDDVTRSFDMVPTGTRCGLNKVCSEHKCVDASFYGEKEECAKKCNNNGVCNHKKECQCNPSWAPPHCDVQYEDLPTVQSGVVPGVSAALLFLLVLTSVVVGLICCKKAKRDNYTAKRKVHSAPGKLNPMFQDLSAKDRPHISQPTFMESTAKQVRDPVCVTVVPGRAAPQSPKKPSAASAPPPPHDEQPKAQPPSKALPPLNNNHQSKAAKPNPPPVPPVKPCPPPPAPWVKPCPPPVPPVKPCPPPPAPWVKPCPPPVPPVKPCPPPVPPAKPKVQRLTRRRSGAEDVKSSLPVLNA
ncbi:zinc metalloproteinase-disintegrin-like VLAIP-B [Diretmus argenteus]